MIMRSLLRFGACLCGCVVCLFLFGADAADSYSFIGKWGSEGPDDGQLDRPGGIAVDSSGNVYVADTFNNRIQKFDSSGEFLAKWGSLGDEDGQFRGPFGIAVDLFGNVFVPDTNNNRIQKFDSSGKFLAKWGSEGPGEGQLSYPTGIAVHSSGNVYVADTVNNRIQKFDSAGNFLTKWGSQGPGDGQLYLPVGMAADSSGNVYVADSENHRIQKFDPSGNFLAKWGSLGPGDGQLESPSDVAVDSWGNLLVADTGNDRIQKLDPSGKFLAKWGSPGTGDGQFDYPDGVAVDSFGNVYVADSDNHRIQKFQRDFRMTGISRAAESFVIEWHSVAGNTYQVWVSADLLEWISVGDPLSASGTGVNTWTDDGLHSLGPPSGALGRFYRVELQEPVEPQVRFYGGTGSAGPHAFDLVEIDPSTGATTLVVDGRYWMGLDFIPDGTTLYAVSDVLYTIDIAAGTYTEIGPLTCQGSEPLSMRSMTIAPDGQMYALGDSYTDPPGEDCYYRIDKATGNLEYLGTRQGFVWAIEFAPDGTLYGAEFDLMILDPTDGSILETIGSLDSAFIVELDFSEDGNLYGTDDDTGLYHINTATGQATLLTDYSGGDELRSLATKLTQTTLRDRTITKEAQIRGNNNLTGHDSILGPEPRCSSVAPADEALLELHRLMKSTHRREYLKAIQTRR